MEILKPLPNAPIGVGMEVHPQTDFIGPIEVGSFWTVRIYPALEEQAVAVGQRFSQLATPTLIVGQWQDDATSLYLRLESQLSSTPHGAAARLEVTLSSPLGAVLDQTTIPVIYDAVTGTQWVTSQIETGTVQGGFNATDRADLQKTVALASFPLGGWIPTIVDAIGDFSSIPYTEELITPDRTGGGVLTRPGLGRNVLAVGIRFRVLDVPDGIGINEGAPPSYDIPPLELGLTRQVFGTDTVTTDSHWFTDTTGEWKWDFNTPHQVLYWIQPGILVRFWWLILPFTLQELVARSQSGHGPDTNG